MHRFAPRSRTKHGQVARSCSSFLDLSSSQGEVRVFKKLFEFWNAQGSAMPFTGIRPPPGFQSLYANPTANQKLIVLPVIRDNS